ncbi:hypothetical protein GQ53DRAFT_768585 [Thozetella sp. PMI_491]|nr:hypothetical protein GQ53DRAFT_768585 [Thozetella sp. PMI_491]
METLYELTVGFTALETALIPIGLLGSTALAIFSFFTSAYGKQRGFIDEPCLSNQLDSIVAVSERIHFLGAFIRGWLNILFAMIEFLLLWATLCVKQEKQYLASLQ